MVAPDRARRPGQLALAVITAIARCPLALTMTDTYSARPHSGAQVLE
jgi:hypothetical protein